MNFKNLRALTGLTLVVAGIAIPAARAQSPRTIYLYNASLGTAPAGVLGAKTAPWGNGEIKPTRQSVQYEGASVLEVTTKNFAEGVRFDLKTPVNIEPYLAKGFIRLRLKFAAAGGRFGGGFPGGGIPGGGIPGGGPGGFPGGGPGGFPGGGPGGGPGGFPGDDGFRGAGQMLPRTQSNAQFGAPGALPPIGGAPGGFPGGGPGGFPGGGPGGFPGGFPGQGGFEGGFPGATLAPAPQRTAITTMRVTLVRENGALVGEIPIDLASVTPDEGGWRLFVLPISAMKSTPGGSGPVQRVVLTSDQEDTFFMAQAALVIETGQMEVSIRPPDAPEGAQLAEVTVKPGPVTLIADVEAGAADPQVEWNFDADSVGNFPPPGGFPGQDNFPGAPGGFPGGGPGGFPGGGIPGGFPGVEGDGAVEITGPRVDARGLTATFTYPNEEQNYRVEVKVTDKSGKKEPVTASILVKVRG